MDVDVKGRRLFVARLENGSVEVVDLRAGKWLKTILGFQKSHGIAYVESLNKVSVASDDDGMLRAFRGDTLDLFDSIKLDLAPNRVIYDAHTKLLYVGYGGKDAGKEYGEVGIVDTKTNKHVGGVNVAAHREEVLLDRSGGTLFVFVSTGKIQVVDTKKHEVISTWPVSSQRNGDSAYGEPTNRLFIGHTHASADDCNEFEVGKRSFRPLDRRRHGTESISMPNTSESTCLVGATRARASSSSKKMRTTTKQSGQITTRTGAGTSFWSPELNRYYVAAPAHDMEEAAILVFDRRLTVFQDFRSNVARKP